ncbi:PREDICTED: fatty acyl-CoA reductase 1-like [Nicrophorus vespilloides]|uniref:Fatty acyl-CoA reductase n=1 Tax=Nicrophorus vespilloides TaxID=110193 RepID=A0ABM1N1C1_NICVS|nr:PREDICTED: fatty acyl-CoA reductase 1-like [Nicrophorus vespilloides]
MTSIDKIVTIPEFYRGKTVFVTGGSGFIGKVLIEKLLRSCPDIGNIYILLRPKKNVSPKTRISTLTNTILFDSVKELHPENIDKLKYVEGDIRSINLGISQDDLEMLRTNIDIIIHIAATIRFTADLTDAALANIRGTRDICHLALSMERKPILMHVSTCYCHHDNNCIEEKMYAPHGDWRKIIEIAETMDRHTLNVMTCKMKGVKHNTYTFTKALAEQTVHDLCVGKIPTIIFRPSIVIGIYEDHIPGYFEGYSGQIGYLIGVLSGIMKCANIPADSTTETVPVDLISKGIINSIWMKGTDQSDEDVSIYNGTGRDLIEYDLHDLNKSLFNVFKETKTELNWYPTWALFDTYIFYYLYFLIFQLFPSLIGDCLISLKKHRPYLVRLQRTLFGFTNLLDYFVKNTWDIQNTKFLNSVANASVHNDDFTVKKPNIDVNIEEKMLLDHVHFILVHYLNKKLTGKPTNLIKLWILWIVWRMIEMSVLVFGVYLVYSIFN